MTDENIESAYCSVKSEKSYHFGTIPSSIKEETDEEANVSSVHCTITGEHLLAQDLGLESQQKTTKTPNHQKEELPIQTHTRNLNRIAKETETHLQTIQSSFGVNILSQKPPQKPEKPPKEKGRNLSISPTHQNKLDTTKQNLENGNQTTSRFRKSFTYFESGKQAQASSIEKNDVLRSSLPPKKSTKPNNEAIRIMKSFSIISPKNLPFSGTSTPESPFAPMANIYKAVLHRHKLSRTPGHRQKASDDAPKSFPSGQRCMTSHN